MIVNRNAALQVVRHGRTRLAGAIERVGQRRRRVQPVQFAANAQTVSSRQRTLAAATFAPIA